MATACAAFVLTLGSARPPEAEPWWDGPHFQTNATHILLAGALFDRLSPEGAGSRWNHWDNASFHSTNRSLPTSTTTPF